MDEQLLPDTSESFNTASQNITVFLFLDFEGLHFTNT